MSDFIDVAKIKVRSGKGGDGMVFFRREKFIPHAGPGGGNGGRGGDVILRVDPHMRTLLDFTFKSKFHADNGVDGGSWDKTGKSAKDLIIRVPPGTVVYNDATGELVADLTGPDYELLAARGGHGGHGNTHFTSATRQAPQFAERGEPAQEYSLRLEMKLLADVGIIGMPSVGKSTLISRISAARPKIADYHFTTLSPNLGVVQLDENRQMVVADMPGLIEGASEGIGLGHQFLRHAERTRVLVHLLDAAAIEGRQPLADFDIINRELALYSEQLASLPQIVALNKVDLSDGRDYSPLYTEELEARGYPVLSISAATGEGLLQLVELVWTKLQEAGGADALTPATGERIVIEMPPPPVIPLRIEQIEEGVFVVTGTEVEQVIARADLKHDEGVAIAHLALEKLGVISRLEEMRVLENDTIIIGDFEFEYRPDWG